MDRRHVRGHQEGQGRGIGQEKCEPKQGRPAEACEKADSGRAGRLERSGFLDYR